jgi:hypothetical protein
MGERNNGLYDLLELGAIVVVATVADNVGDIVSNAIVLIGNIDALVP